MRKTNWKVILFIWIPSFLIISFVFGLEGAIGAGFNALIAYIPTYLITKLLKIDINVYYDHRGKSITKEEYEKLDDKIDYGFSWLPKRLIKKNGKES